MSRWQDRCSRVPQLKSGKTRGERRGGQMIRGFSVRVRGFSGFFLKILIVAIKMLVFWCIMSQKRIKDVFVVLKLSVRIFLYRFRSYLYNYRLFFPFCLANINEKFKKTGGIHCLCTIVNPCAALQYKLHKNKELLVKNIFLIVIIYMLKAKEQHLITMYL